MNKQSLILKYFQKADQLTINNQDYRRSITALFNYLSENDKAENDLTTGLLNLTASHQAQIISNEKAILAGIEEILYLLKRETHLSFKPLVQDGEETKKDQPVAKIKGPVA